MHRSTHALLKLPLQMTATIGRQLEIETLTALLRQEEARLVTLTGPGGVGKTRLSLEVARALYQDFPEGVCFVSLAPLRGREQVFLALLNAFGIAESSKDAPWIAYIPTSIRAKCSCSSITLNICWT
ncbi:AAA family ATPase [Ktedonospora formicarum]|uniref:Orc1-like AAA ATPase domain-containing protein n=1 Tax=Ktedonospora formicarum TaxID=2778364 RepID=A0A8J3MUN5_9CHLR|nr:AAA family ATPase [Ktedonospora formicarum]GHO48415.1 hypothetical protein KSX_65780 [Ktedonospora formicarum]